jgi:DnaJ-class molecular chaperone
MVLYDILGVSEMAENGEIQKAFELSKNSFEASKKSFEVSKISFEASKMAYEVLGDAVKRGQYDLKREKEKNKVSDSSE